MINIHEETRDILNEYLSLFEKQNTKESYSSGLSMFFESRAVPCGRLEELESHHVNGWIDYAISERDWSPRTLSQRINILRSFYNWAREMGYVSQDHKNPFARGRIKRVRTQSDGDDFIQVLSEDDLFHILGAIEGNDIEAKRDRVMIKMLAQLCLRRSEAVASDFEHIVREGEHYVLRIFDAKGGAAQHVKVPGSLYKDIMDLMMAYEEYEGPILRSLSTRNYLGRLSASGLYQIIKRRLRRAKMDFNLHPHTFRHSGCTIAFENGATLKQVQAHARHKHINTTMKYVHQTDALDNSAADLIPAEPIPA